MLRGTWTQNQIWLPPPTHLNPKGDDGVLFIYYSFPCWPRHSLRTSSQTTPELFAQRRPAVSLQFQISNTEALTELWEQSIWKSLKYLLLYQELHFRNSLAVPSDSPSLPSASFLHPAGTKKERYRCTPVTLSIRGRSPSDKAGKHFPAAPPAPGWFLEGQQAGVEQQPMPALPARPQRTPPPSHTSCLCYQHRVARACLASVGHWLQDTDCHSLSWSVKLNFSQ